MLWTNEENYVDTFMWGSQQLEFYFNGVQNKLSSACNILIFPVMA